MSTIVTRTGKGSALTWAEADANFDNLNNDKMELAEIHAATSKTTPVDADELPLVDSASTFSLKKLTWANIKATLKTYFDSLYWGGVSADLVSATTLDLTGSRSIVRVTGTTATTAVTINAGQRVECIAVNAWPLTYHATNMPLPTNGFNYTCSGGDKVIFSKDNNGTLFVQLEKLSGFPNAGGGDQAITFGALGTQAQITSNTNDWNLSQYWGGARISSDAARDVTGILSGWNSRTLTLHNIGSFPITLKDESASSIAAARFALQSDIVLQPDATVMLQYDATTLRWRAIGAPTANTVVKVVEATPVTSVITIATATTLDDSIPQNTEGTEVITVSITPTSTTNRLRIEFNAPTIGTASSGALVAALFQDTTANALAAGYAYTSGASAAPLSLTHEMAAGTTASTTFKIRLSCQSGAAYLNGNLNLGTRAFGGVSAARLRVIELAP